MNRYWTTRRVVATVLLCYSAILGVTFAAGAVIAWVADGELVLVGPKK